MLSQKIIIQDGFVPITKVAKDPHQNISILIEHYLKSIPILCWIIACALFLESIKFKPVVTLISILGWTENAIKICIMPKFTKLFYQKNHLPMLILLRLDAITYNLSKSLQMANLTKIELADGFLLKLTNNFIEKII